MSQINVTEIFASHVFNDAVMKERLSKEVYASVKRAMQGGAALSVKDAKVVAEAMKNWAIEKGATHFTHWFQPMTGITAEKHDGFIDLGENGTAITKFSEKSLVRGESDASSFPTGGLRATFEARGYTVWDPTSYAFVKDGSLYIPTAFCSYGGEALDKKTPLLRSMESLNKEAMRILKLFGDTTTKRVLPTVGAEQEYFLIDKSVYEKRRDLIYCGRTLFGAPASKGQELDDHYCGAIKPRIAAFMKELDEELWKLGVYAKTKHNEVAPSQHELAPIFTTANVACDHNQLTMEIMKVVANRHGLVCLLHEKPFASVSGSGKHDNWSLSTDLGENLLEPGNSSATTARFLLFLVAIISAVDNNQDLLRLSVASNSNDHRLGASEAPPAIISVYLGENLEGILSGIENGTISEYYNKKDPSEIKLGISLLPSFANDSADRNRTSPIAFTGNKFEFRMVGSSENIACPNFILNTIVAEELSKIADQLEGVKDFNSKLNSVLQEKIRKHKRILFSGNNYSGAWQKEAARRGLLNLKTTAVALPKFTDAKNIALFKKHKVLTTNEIKSRLEVLLDNYVKHVKIEARTAIDMARKQIVPSLLGYQTFVIEAFMAKSRAGVPGKYKLEEDLIKKLSKLSDLFHDKLEKLAKDLSEMEKHTAIKLKADYCESVIIPSLNSLRACYDEIEPLLSEEFKPFPNYDDILYSVK
ncbi:MAG: glutamine synthetase III [Clostridia bacterium]|nr:glutamine synthetase III [Clostridia bacterium]